MMKRRFQWCGLISSMAVLTFAGMAIAEQPGVQGAVSSPGVVLETVLRDWQWANSTIDRLDVRFVSIQYDEVFEVARLGRGLLSVDRQGRGFYKIEPRVREVEQSLTGPQSGRPEYRNYKVRPTAPECWYWTGTSVIQVDHAALTYEESAIFDATPSAASSLLRSHADRPAPPPLPEDVPNQKPNPLTKTDAGAALELKTLTNSATSLDFSGFILLPYFFSDSEWRFNLAEFRLPAQDHPLARPFLLETPLDELRQRYQTSLFKQTETEIWLKFVPKSRPRDIRFEHAMLILGRSDYQPKALKIVDGSRATVLIFSDLLINQPPMPPFGDLQKPNLDGYRRMIGPRKPSPAPSTR